MAKVLNCRHVGIECEYICSESEAELLEKAGQFAKKGAEGERESSAGIKF